MQATKKKTMVERALIKRKKSQTLIQNISKLKASISNDKLSPNPISIHKSLMIKQKARRPNFKIEENYDDIIKQL